MLKDPHAQEEGKEKLVFLEQWTTHVTVQAECEVIIDVLRALWYIIYNTIGCL